LTTSDEGENKKGCDRKRMNSKENGFYEEKSDLAETIVNFAFVCKGSLKEFENIRSYILRFSQATLVFQTKSIGPLWIERRQFKPLEAKEK